jgi:hypothetical protein
MAAGRAGARPPWPETHTHSAGDRSRPSPEPIDAAATGTAVRGIRKTNPTGHSPCPCPSASPECRPSCAASSSAIGARPRMSQRRGASAVSGTPANPPTASVSGKNSAESHQSPAEPVGAVALATNSTPVPAPGKPTNQPTVSPRALTLITVGRTVGTTRRNRRRSRTHLTVRRAVLPMCVRWVAARDDQPGRPGP